MRPENDNREHAAPDEDVDPANGEAADGGARRFVADTVRKAVLTGLGAFFLTEEGARKLAREWKLPKEIVGYILSQGGSAKDEIVRVVSDEVRKFFESESLRREFLRLVSSMSVEVHAELRLKPARGGRVEPEVKISAVKPHLRRKDDVQRDAAGEHDPAPKPKG